MNILRKIFYVRYKKMQIQLLQRLINSGIPKENKDKLGVNLNSGYKPFTGNHFSGDNKQTPDNIRKTLLILKTVRQYKLETLIKL